MCVRLSSRDEDRVEQKRQCELVSPERAAAIFWSMVMLTSSSVASTSMARLTPCALGAGVSSTVSRAVEVEAMGSAEGTVSGSASSAAAAGLGLESALISFSLCFLD